VRIILIVARRALAVLALLASPTAVTAAAADPTPAEAREIARDAYVYGFPLVDHYRIQHAYFVDRTNPEHKGPWNRIHSVSRVYTPADTAIQTPNSDTPYSFAGPDLRAEPMVLTLPAIEPRRYQSVQLIDAYTHNFAYLGTRETGNGGGRFLIAGPGWRGTAPAGIDGVIRAETAFVFAAFRTQLFEPADLPNVARIQRGYSVQPLSRFRGTAAPAASPIAFPPPLTVQAQRTDPRFFGLLNFVLSQQPAHPSEAALRARFARLGIGPGLRFDAHRRSPELREAIEAGMADAWRAHDAFKAAKIDTGEVVSGDLFGTRAFLGGDTIKRMIGATLGIYGNSREEAMYPAYFVDATGRRLDGATGRYALRFGPGQVPPVDAFWSLTLYELPSSLLSANRLNRYLINAPMLPSLRRDADGGVTLHVRHQSPGPELESNWLPAPNGPFFMVLRLYLPRAEAIDGRWTEPKLQPLQAGARGAPEGPAAAAGAAPTGPAPAGLVPVTPQTYVRAETDRNFANLERLAGGVNRFFHFRTPTPLDRQTVVRMNKDTLYSGAVVDTEGGATVTLPEADAGRYMSILVIDNDHYAPAVFYRPGTHRLPTDTQYVQLVVRTQLLRPDDPDDVARANALQDRVTLTAARADPLPPSRWDPVTLKALTERYELESARYPSFRGMMGARGTVDESTRHIAAAAGWGLLPDEHASYLNYSGGHDAAICHRATFSVPQNDAFWSITVYGSDGYMKHANAILNASNARPNPDGTITARFGSVAACGDLPNRLPRVVPGH
jgi:hypothetical protein